MLKDVYIKSCKFVAKNFSGLFKGINLEWEKELEEAIQFTKFPVTPKEVTVFTWFMGIMIFGATFAFSMFSSLFGFEPLQVLFLGTILAAATMYFIPYYPKNLMFKERMNCLGYAPHLIAYLIIPLKQDPNLEKAVKFAAESSDDKLTQDLKELLWQTWAGKHNSIGEALPALGLKWGQYIKGFRDALYAIRASQIEKHEARRLSTLDRALKDLLSNIRNRFKEFINDLRVPTMVLFMCGVLIPMVVVMFLPVLYMMGLEIGSPLGVTAILSVIVFGVYVIAEYILSRRPVSFSPIQVPKDYPGLPSPGKIRAGERETSLLRFSLVVAILISFGSLPYFFGYDIEIVQQLNTLPIVIGVFAGLWTYFYFDSKDRIKVRNQIEQAEEDCVEACFHIGNRLMSGMPAEESLIRVSEMLSGPKHDSLLSRILEATVRNIRYANMRMREAFFDPDRGSLKNVHSGLIHGLFKLFANSIERGVDAAAETLINSTLHFRDIRKVEQQLREQVSYTTSMMKVSATMIAPAMCAITIPMTEAFISIMNRLSGEAGSSGLISDFSIGILRPPSLTPPVLTLILGGYILSLLLILIRFTTILEYGNDEVKTKVELAKSLPIALMVFIVMLTTSRMLFAGMMA